jgi:hypothetical protein
MSDIAIRVENLSKLYKIGARQNRHDTLRDKLTEVVTAPFRRLSSVLDHSSSVIRHRSSVVNSSVPGPRSSVVNSSVLSPRSPVLNPLSSVLGRLSLILRSSVLGLLSSVRGHLSLILLSSVLGRLSSLTTPSGRFGMFPSKSSEVKLSASSVAMVQARAPCLKSFLVSQNEWKRRSRYMAGRLGRENG